MGYSGPVGRAIRQFLGPAVALLVIVGASTAPRAGDIAVASPQDAVLAPVANLFQAVQSRFPGRILTVELELSKSPIYEVKLLTDSGMVLELFFNAQTLILESVNGHSDSDAPGPEGKGGGQSDDDEDGDEDGEGDGDNSGSGSDSDNSGSGSDNSGSGGGNSGSGSSGDDGPDHD